MNAMPGLEGKTALVCGATGGIGRVIALRLARAGADVAVNGRNPVAGAGAVAEIEARGRKGMFLPADLTDYQQVKDMVEQVRSKWGMIDVLIASGAAEHPPPQFFHETDPALYPEYMKTYLYTRLYPVRAVLDSMKERKAGSIVITTSEAGRVPTPGESLIGAAGAGLVMATKVLAREFSRWQIRVNAIGITVTENTPAYNRSIALPGSLGKIFQRAVEGIPFWPITTDDVADLALFLAADVSGRITGQAVSITGGLTFPG